MTKDEKRPQPNFLVEREHRPDHAAMLAALRIVLRLPPAAGGEKRGHD